MRAVVRGAMVLSFCVVACGARTDLGGGHRGGSSDADASDAADVEAGPRPPPCTVTAPTVLAAGGKEIQFVALDDDDVYWTDFALGTIDAVAKGGGAPHVLAAARGAPSGIAASHGTVYWTEFKGDVVASTSIAGGSVTTLASKQDGAYDVTVSDDSIYWTTFRGCTVASLESGSSKQLDHANQPFTSIVSHDSLVFWVSYEQKSVIRYDAATEARSTLVNGGSKLPFAIATDGVSVYYGETSSTGVRIASVPTAGGPSTTLDEFDCSTDGGLVGTCFADVATDGKMVYFTGAGGVRKVPVGGGETVVVADHQTRPFSVAVDDTCVYWSDLDEGTIWAAPK